jgi:hypothetical protein
MVCSDDGCGPHVSIEARPSDSSASPAGALFTLRRALVGAACIFARRPGAFAFSDQLSNGRAERWLSTTSSERCNVETKAEADGAMRPPSKRYIGDIMPEVHDVVPHFIGGRWVASSASGFVPVHNPARGEVIARTPLAPKAEAEAALQALDESRGSARRGCVNELHAGRRPGERGKARR